MKQQSTFERAVIKAETLLSSQETSLPENVYETIRLLNEKGIWFRLSRNSAVTSCRDAAHNRIRLGHKGIPLFDEVRSYLVEMERRSSQSSYAILHCRADKNIDLQIVKNIKMFSGKNFAKYQTNRLADEGIGYGLINPFSCISLLQERGKVIQIFDPDMQTSMGETDTMMTNAGDRTWGIEFNPREYAEKMTDCNIVVAPITAFDPEPRIHKKPTIGILTGNAPESGALLWNKINNRYKDSVSTEFRGDISYPRIVVHSIPQMGWTMELQDRAEKIWPEIDKEVDCMIAGGMDDLAIACNTTQYFEKDLVEKMAKSSGSFLPLSTPILEWIQTLGGSRVFVAGIGAVTESQKWSAFSYLHEMSNVMLPDSAQTKLIEEIAYTVKQGTVDNVGYQKFRSLIRSADCENILLLLTELSMIFDRFPRVAKGMGNIFDSVDIYADYIVRTHLKKT